MNEFEFQAEIKVLEDINAKLEKKLGEATMALDIAKVKAREDADTITELSNMCLRYEAQIEAFKFCITKGAATV
jgi:hypothetical protein